MPLCLMENIRKTFHSGAIEVEVLKSINLRLERREFVAIMGTSGSGKTTLMNIIGCLDTPTSGRYVLADKEVSHLSDDELSFIRNEHIGFVFQNFYLLPYATVLENVLLPTLYVDKHKDNREQQAVDLLQLVGLKERIRFKPNQLSGGEQQRVAIARALVNDPDLLLADEPTGQLDSKTAEEIMNLLREMNTRGKTVLLITHDQNVAAYAQRTVQIKDGIILE
ncbi:MAG: ABC transporter ATP-binding protein [Thermodesulfovibrionales bacterium]|nr:ABC transporter ATP-binding protein [Thermodesulfovibrionales bacterium]